MAQVVESDFTLVRGPPPAEASEYNAELIDYVLCNMEYRTGDMRCASKKEAARVAERKKYELRARSAFSMLNGHGLSGGGPIVHYCTGCCRSRRDAVRKAVDAVRALMLAKQPVVPSLGKWTKFGRCLDWFLLGNVEGLLLRLLRRGCAKIRIPTGAVDGEGAAADVPEELAWHEIAGARLLRFTRFLESDARRFHIVLLCVVLEPLRALHSCFMAAGSAPARPTEGPPLLNLIWERRSVVTKAMQWYGTLLSGKCSRLRLLWQTHDGCDSLAAWQRQYPEHARLLYRMVVFAAAWVQRRHGLYVLKQGQRRWPLSLFALGDARRASEHAVVARDFMQMRPCCLPPGMARQLRLHPDMSEALLCSGPQQEAFFGASAMAWVSMSDIEGRHAKSRRMAHAQMPWHVFAAASTNREATDLRNLRQRRESASAEEAPRRAKKHEPSLLAPGQPRPWRRAQSPLQIFRLKWLKEQVVLGRRCNPCSASTWAAVRAAWEAEPQEQQHLHRIASLASSGAARAARAKAGQHKYLRNEEQLQVVPHVPAEGPTSRGPPDVVAVNESLALSRLDEPLVVARTEGPSEVVALQERSATRWPMGAALLQKLLRTVGKVVEAWTGTAPVIAGDSSARVAAERDQPFPDAVLEQKCCGELCCTTTTLRKLKMQADLVAAWLAFARRSSRGGQIAAVALADAVFAVTVQGEHGREPHVRFAVMTAGSGRSGRESARLMFALLEVAGGDATPPFANLTLRHAREAFCEASRTGEPARGAEGTVLHRATAGALQCLTEDEFSAVLLSSPSELELGAVESVACQALETSIVPGTLDHLRVTGTKGEPFDVSSAGNPRVPRRRREGAGELLDLVLEDTRDATAAKAKAAKAAKATNTERMDRMDGESADEVEAPWGHRHRERDDGSWLSEILGEIIANVAAEDDEEGDAVSELHALLREADVVEADEEDGRESDESEEPAEEAGGAAPVPTASSSASASASASAADPPPAEPDGPDGADLTGLLRSLGLRDMGGYSFKHGDRVVGNIRIVNLQGKATCRSHGNCVCWLNRSHREALADLVRWLADGLVASEADHKQAAFSLKRDKYQMRVREKKL